MRSAAFFPPPAPAGRPRLAARNGFRFLLLCGCYAGSGRCGGVLRTSAHRAISITLSNDLCVAVMQVDEVGGGDLREMAGFRGAFAAEMEGWAAQERVYGALRGAAQPAWTLRRGLARWRLDWRL